MKKRIKLKDIVSEMDMISAELNFYLNTKTGEIVRVSEEDLLYIDEENGQYSETRIANFPDWQQQQIRTAHTAITSDDYIQFPTKYDIHEYQIMEDFCKVVANKRIANNLLGTIKGKGAFRNFKDKIFKYDLRDEYHAFKEKAFYEIAQEWCEENNIEYEEVPKKRQKPTLVAKHLVEEIEAEDLTVGEIKVILRGADPLIARGGRTLLAKLLNGSKAKNVLRMDLDTCPVYGHFSELTEAKIILKIDWMIQHGYLTTETYDRFPLLVFTPKGWEIEKDTYAEGLLTSFEKILKKGVPFELAHLKDQNREIIFLLLEKVRDSGDRRLIFILEAWSEIAYKKVKQRIHSVIKSLEKVG